MRLLFIAILGLMLASCRVTRYIDRVRVESDSTAIRERDSLIAVKRSDSAAYTSLIQSLSENRVEFRDTGSVRIIYRPDGSIQEVTGQVKTLSGRLVRTQAEASYWKRLYDSTAATRSRDSIRTVERVVTVTDKKRVAFIPWWVWLLAAGCLVAGHQARPLFQKIKTLLT